MDMAAIVTAVTVLGFVCIWIVLGLLSLLTIAWGRKVFKDLRRVYHLTVIAYWLTRLESGGWRVFQKAENSDKESARTRGDEVGKKP